MKKTKSLIQNSYKRNKFTVYHKEMGVTKTVTLLTPPRLKGKKLLYNYLSSGAVSFLMSILLFTYGGLSSSEMINSFFTTTRQNTSENVVHANSKTINDTEDSDIVFARQNDIDSDFGIYIPAINAKSKVSANIDSQNSKEYEEALKVSVAHAKGTALPGETGRVYLFAHSTNNLLNFERYNAVFYKLNDLKIGDAIYIVYRQKLYKYKMNDRKIVSGTDTSWISRSSSDELVLQTCYPPGTSLKRLLVIASK